MEICTSYNFYGITGIPTGIFRLSPGWPAIDRYLIIICLLGGMLFAALRAKRFQIRRPTERIVPFHLLAGSLMGVGAALAKGGNDSQLLLTLPVFSPAGALAVAFMLFGLFLGLKITPHSPQ